MTGDYTKVPLRARERWTGARMQQGRVLLDHEWNLNLDAATRTDQDTARDAIGPAGVVAGSAAFQVAVSGGGLTVQPGRMWVDGLAAHAPAAFSYADQDQIPALPSGGRAIVYLDVFTEHIQPAEQPAALVDPALAPVDSCARTRVGWRVRAAATTATDCAAAMAGLGLAALSTGRLSIGRTAQAGPADPCDPPGDPRGLLPDGLLRVEVLDSGSAATARFVWSYENGAAAVPGTVAGDAVTLAPTPAVKFAKDDLVEVSWLARRADRLDHGALYQVTDVTPAAAGDVLTLDRTVTAPAGADGLVVRRWDGQRVGATAAVKALHGTVDLGVEFTAAAGSYRAGDWWGAWLRPEHPLGVEERTTAVPDGIVHAFAPLALVDLTAGTVLSDCRPTFEPLTAIDRRTSCTVVVMPGEDLQAAVDSLPPTGGEVCLAAGEYVVLSPVTVANRNRVVICGVGPATVIRAEGTETALLFDRCTEVEVCRLRAVGGAPPGPQAHLNGAVTFVACTDVRVSDCDLSCADRPERAAACVAVRAGVGGQPDRVAIEGNRCTVGAWQVGILVADAGETTIRGNTVRFPAGKTIAAALLPRETVAVTLSRTAAVVQQALLRPDMKAFLAAFEAKAPQLIAQHGSRRDALVAFARHVLAPTKPDDVDEPLWTAMGRILAGYVAGAAGIVVGGGRASVVRVLDNLVAGVVQGIRVATSAVGARVRADDVLVSRNTIRLLVPNGHRRERHAVYLGNARTAAVTETSATLTRNGTALIILGNTPVEGVRVYGELGANLVVRQTSLQGFGVGVRVRALDPKPAPTQRLWLVAETMAATAGVVTSVDAPDAVGANNIPA